MYVCICLVTCPVMQSKQTTPPTYSSSKTSTLSKFFTPLSSSPSISKPLGITKTPAVETLIRHAVRAIVFVCFAVVSLCLTCLPGVRSRAKLKECFQHLPRPDCVRQVQTSPSSVVATAADALICRWIGRIYVHGPSEADLSHLRR
jgi:hypothetical protein